MNKLFSNKKTRRIIVAVMCVLLLAITTVFGITIVKEVKKIGTGSEIVKDNELYALDSRATSYQKKLYKELSKSVNDGIENNKLVVAECVAKSFVADFFTWTNKEGSYDVGGLEYVYSPQVENISLQARNHFYYYLSYYINEYGSENLLEVDNVEASAVFGGTEIEGQTFPGFYYVETTWSYKDSSVFDTSKYPTSAAMHIAITDEGRMEIVNFYVLG